MTRNRPRQGHGQGATRPADLLVAAPGGAGQALWAPRLEGLAWLLLLAVLAARPFLSELPYRYPLLRQAAALLASGPGQQAPPAMIDRTEEARVTLAIVVLVAMSLWATAQALRGRLSVAHRGAVILSAGVVVWAAVSAALAASQRDAWNTWLDQSALLAGAVLTLQLARCPARRGQLLALLVALAGTMAAKGLWQYFVEAPDRIAMFEAERVEHLRQAGITPRSTQATLFEYRVRDRSPFGYFGLANLFASLLLMLVSTAAGVATARWGQAIAQLRRPRQKGDVPLEVLSAAVVSLVALSAAAVLGLTASRGALAAALAVGMLGGLCWTMRRRLARRWKLYVGLGCGVFLAGCLAVAACGLRTGGLPTKTMTFRWLYWSASGRMVREQPLVGVGPGNFADAYLRHRSEAAEEEVKAPHNVIAHAASQLGLPGAAMYLGVIGYLLVGSIRPRRGQLQTAQPTATSDGQQTLPPARATSANAPAATTALAAGAAALWALHQAGLTSTPLLLVIEGVAPAALLAGLVLAASWAGQRLDLTSLGESSAVRWLVALGLGAFALHSMVELSFWAPAAAMTFFMLSAAGTAQASDGKTLLLSRGRWAIAAGAWLAPLATAVLIFLPVHARLAASQQALDAAAAGNLAQAVELAARAARADPADAQAPAEAARLIADHCHLRPPQEQASCHGRALRLLNTAMRRNPASSAYRRQAGLVTWNLAIVENSPSRFDQALDLLAQAIDLNPQDIDLRLLYAQRLCDRGRFDQCLSQLAQARRIESHLIRPSLEQFSPQQLRLIAELEARARGEKPPTSQP